MDNALHLIHETIELVAAADVVAAEPLEELREIVDGGVSKYL